MKLTLPVLMMFVAYVTSQDLSKGVQAFGQGMKIFGQGIEQGVQRMGKGVQVVEKAVQTEVEALKQPIEETFVTVASSQCSNIKKLVGKLYEQMGGETEPDLNSLTLVYRTRQFNHTYNISTAAEDLRQARAFESRRKLVVFVHGFTDDPSKEAFSTICDSLLGCDDGDSFAVLALDGSTLIRWLYLRSTTYVPYMGRKLAEVLTAIVKDGLDPSDIHVVGHSLGAHICSSAGKQFYSLNGKKLGRISGLDPAGPCFINIDPALRLQASDAAYVDVIHSDSGVYGMTSPLGHVDYYPNSGAQQPDCFFETCSHMFACLVFAESIMRRDAFPARRCDSWDDFVDGQCDDEISYMGYASDAGSRGTFFLQTSSKSPYGLGTAGLNYTNNAGLVRNGQHASKKVPGVKDMPLVD